VWVKRGLCSADSVINIALCSEFPFPHSPRYYRNHRLSTSSNH
jgi:hypothetical protein